MFKVSNPQYLISDQYQNSEKLRARIALFERFSTNREDFAHWMFSHLEADSQARVLELGCGPANLWVKSRERIPAAGQITLTDLPPVWSKKPAPQGRASPGPSSFTSLTLKHFPSRRRVTQRCHRQPHALSRPEH